MDIEELLRAWAHTVAEAEALDPAIREALRPVYERLRDDAPDAAAAMALSMVMRALRMIQTRDGEPIEPIRRMLCEVAQAAVSAEPDHPEG